MEMEDVPFQRATRTHTGLGKDLKTLLIGLCCWEMSIAKKSQGYEETEVGFSITHSEAQTFRIVLNPKNKVRESMGMRGRESVGI